MGMTLKELLTKGEGTLSAQEAKTLAAQCRMDVETLYTLLEERGIKIIEDEADADVNLDVDSIIAEVENAENNSDELGLGGDDEEEAAEENPADLKAAMDELLDDPRRTVHVLLRSVRDECRGGRAQRQPRRLRPALPPALRGQRALPRRPVGTEKPQTVQDGEVRCASPRYVMKKGVSCMERKEFKAESKRLLDLMIN